MDYREVQGGAGTLERVMSLLTPRVTRMMVWILDMSISGVSRVSLFSP